MPNVQEISISLRTSPSITLLCLKNREWVIQFLLEAFPTQQPSNSSEKLQLALIKYIETNLDSINDNDEFDLADDFNTDQDLSLTTYEAKAKRYIQHWTNKGFLSNYQDDQGIIFYELSSHTNKTLDWLQSLTKEEFVGTESKFKYIFSQLKELVENTNDNVENRIQVLEQKKLEIEQQIQRLKIGEDINIYEEYQITPRFKEITQSAKELLSDFKEVEENFKSITKDIYQRHAEGNLYKSDILQFAFDSLDALKESSQGKSFYAFWSFLLNPSLQQEWDSLVISLYEMLQEKNIQIDDFFLRGMKKYLYQSGQKVYKANDRMAEKLSRIIRESEASQSALTKSIIQDIKKSLLILNKHNQKPDIGFELETSAEIKIPFEKKLSYEKSKPVDYKINPTLASMDLAHSEQLAKLFAHIHVDKKKIRQHIQGILLHQSQASIQELIDKQGGLSQGLPELFGYMDVIKDFKHTVNDEHQLRICFDQAQQKVIQIPEIIVICS
ncbi:DUF3375 domain-containing protein [Acinetobacter sp. ASP199]|uniref:DUF3375 domain-containing protein n=1 Tax=unclassified Acinetobacter TaxID=196816 RepID=UPI001F621FF6|nr:DUF3375 domain-containing protein [Acinetobacter sp. ASP199]UNT58674.1 DUF3375 domain-containing protein [Acinetobacter sp. ASP199]